MGMDQYFVATDKPMSPKRLWRQDEGWYWRKHYRLMEFFARKAHYVDFDNEGDFDDGTYELNAALLDELEATLNSEVGLPSLRNSRWFDGDCDAVPRLIERTAEKTAYDLEAVQWARGRLSEGKRVYYRVSY